MSFQIPTRVKDDLYTRGIFSVTGEINFETIHNLLSFIYGNRPDKNRFTILISSSGGSPSAVQYFWSMINVLHRNVKLRGIAFGECGSAALTLLQCCTHRYGVDGCTFFIHNMQYNPKIDCRLFDEEAFRQELESTRRLEDEMVRIQCLRTKMSEGKWRELARLGSGSEPRPVFCNEAKKIGLIDRILPFFHVF